MRINTFIAGMLFMGLMIFLGCLYYNLFELTFGYIVLIALTIVAIIINLYCDRRD